MANSTRASEIISAIGGASNVKTLTHCATRLRFELFDGNKVDQQRMESIKGVLGAVPQAGNRYQVVIGGAVATVYEEVIALPEMAGRAQGTVDADDGMTNADVKAEAHAKGKSKNGWVNSFFEYLADSFRPILGVLLGASLIIALVNLLISIHVIGGSEETTGLVFVEAIWKGVFYFLPIMIAYNASKKLKVDPWLGGAIMGMLMTPQFMSLFDEKGHGVALKAVAAIRGVDLKSLQGWHDAVSCVPNQALGTQMCTAKVFGLPMILNDYSGNVFVPLLMAAVLALVYRGLNKIIPESVQIVFVPFLCMVIVGALTAYLIGPLGVFAGNYLGIGLAFLNKYVPFVLAILIPMLYPFLVPLGLHWPLNALMLLNLNTLGYDFIQGPMGTWNFACFGATAGVLYLSIRDKDKDMRQVSLGALLAGLLGGVSEPSLYGIHLRYKKIYSRMLPGCAAGGVTIAVLGWLFPSVVNGAAVHGVTANAFAFTSLLTIPIFSQVWVYAVSIAVAFFVAMFGIIFFDYRTPEQKAALKATAAQGSDAAAPAPAVAAAPAAAPVATATATAVATTVVGSPVAGHVISLDDAGDPVFASRALGEGVGIQPAASTIVAPVSGTLQTVAETGHAFGIATADGVEVLVHVGIDTVKMNGDGFSVAVAKGQSVNAGDTLATVDFDKVTKAGFSTTTLVTVLNTAELGSVTPQPGKDVQAGDPVLDIVR
ncbi:glucose PTS transporter subunit IIA [Bifidobacterium subtile]|jgi:PTS system beta-glucosides-specific IIC component|uniref:Beta-glucosides-specific IIA component n=1 Tax=Bifidobacterium subtile TaxID=77635 RepID=A0A087E3W7_9BIFI|nr:glucose PTS transporter subunit IIA [Bifidobacterium subtile]KFJ02468.1 beta-glucosides-specific IIA component [Bifidobacterium subtile]MCI1222743.1 glucose PTS transporter subunit IIA [Bifidobacterium subtile]MCI1240693.1 glucose PTS transporter subunit IIA [Bifidobacterium subtile]MCI1257734.1 glucose PTS transporter subunit IIA [Bifidobacterium subtile]QOL35911.1 PTS glucose transporter subunit IIA [Bifidobacterium subtile]